MSDKRLSPSGAITGAKESGGSDTNNTNPDDELAAFKRRRDAALRCEPLASGRRDPLFDWDGAARALSSNPKPVDRVRSPIRIEFDTPHNSALIRGYKGGDYCRFVGGRGMWIEARRGWVTSARTARDVIAAVERDGRLLILSEIEGGL